MAITESTMLALGTKAPNFYLPDTRTGEIISLHTFVDKKALLVMFICNHCPFVKHIQYELMQLGKDYAHKSVGIIAISANDAEKHPEDSPEKLKENALKLGYNFPYCYDETQEVAKAYTAACTPDFFLFNQKRALVYRGQLDDSRPSNNIPVTGTDLRTAIEAILSDQPISSIQKPSIGCNIKWKTNNAPNYYQ
jgi:peroxiredoxin